MSTTAGDRTLSPATPGTLGTFAGVFTPSILTILGIILFLRLGYVVGTSGLAAALVIILAANAISVLTSFSVAAIATNLKVKGGGDYYVISRTLGVGFGGAIGLVLFLAQSISIGFYAVGFGEAVAALTGGEGAEAQLIAAGAVAALFVLAWLGADWATRAQYIVMALILAALVSFVAGAVGMFDATTLERNWARPEGNIPFWVAFAVFFPAVTGFTQGVSMSGDLADSGRSIPRGTFMAVSLSLVVYVSVAVLMAGAKPLAVLSRDAGAMNAIAVFAPLIDAGAIAATASSALASFMGAPRILQALAADKVFPLLGTFATGHGDASNPRRGVMLSGAIALCVVALGNLNAIAAVVSMFFLVSYGLLNYATYYEARANSPSFRPTFRLYDRRISLVGGLVCLGAMLAIDIMAGLAAASVVIAFYQYVSRRAPQVSWFDSRRSHHLRLVRQNLIAAARETPHPRDWRAQVLVFSADKKRRALLLEFAEWIEGESGLTTVITILQGSGPAMIDKRREVLKALGEELAGRDAMAFPLVVTSPELDAAISTAVQTAGIGPLQVNTVLANWLEDTPAVIGPAALGRYGRNLRTAFRLGCNLLVLDADASEWATLSQIPPENRRIDVWWRKSKTGELMLLLAYLMTRHAAWKDASVRVLATSDANASGSARIEEVKAFLADVRIEAEAIIVEDASIDAIVTQSKESHIVFMPFSVHAGQFYGLFGGAVADILPKLKIVLMAMAAQDVDLGADPDEVDDGEGEK